MGKESVKDRPQRHPLSAKDYARIKDDLDRLAQEVKVYCGILEPAFGPAFGEKVGAIERAILQLRGRVDDKFFAQTQAATLRAVELDDLLYQPARRTRTPSNGQVADPNSPALGLMSPATEGTR